MSVLGELFGAAYGLAVLEGALLSFKAGRPLYGLRWFFFGSALGALTAGLLDQNWPEAAFCAIALAVFAWGRWGGKGKRAVKALGAKSKALVDGLAGRMRDAWPQPAPQGAGA